ncbi:hypothetical protein BJV74DRAFT_833962 [Russula compacta]|nr:hypothetical protein BJV74DRAFT_833962 [Russula compacta]
MHPHIPHTASPIAASNAADQVAVHRVLYSASVAAPVQLILGRSGYAHHVSALSRTASPYLAANQVGPR